MFSGDYKPGKAEPITFEAMSEAILKACEGRPRTPLRYVSYDEYQVLSDMVGEGKIDLSGLPKDEDAFLEYRKRLNDMRSSRETAKAIEADSIECRDHIEIPIQTLPED